MRFRAASIATLLNVIVCSLLIAACSVTAASLQNELITEEIRITCRLSAEALRQGKDQDAPEEYLNDISSEENILFAYFGNDGKVVQDNFDFEPQLPTQKELEETQDGLTTYSRRTALGKKLIYVSATLEDGSRICFAKEAVIVAKSLGEYMWVVIMIIFAALIMQFVIIYRSVWRSDAMVESIMRVLEDFTEGNFDSRIKGVYAASRSVAAKYNATFARVQDRVFGQQKRNRIFGQVLNQMQTGIISADNNMDVVFTTQMTGELFGVDTTDAEGKQLYSVFKNEDLENAFREAMNSQTGNMHVAELEGKNPDGSVRPLRIYASPLLREGKSGGILSVVEDVTEVKNLEQLRTDFAANVSHEMKTPLTSIKGFVETLQAGAIEHPEMARKFLNIIMIEADRLTRLINDILSISKMESGNESVEIKKIALDRQVMEVCDLLKIHATEKEVTVNAKPNPTPAYIMGNPDRVKQLLINLIENGIKYNKVGGSVTVKVLEDDQNINLVVADTGIGVKKENLGRLFERFYRVDKGRSRAMGGTGLGLAIVKHIVNSMNGFIEVSSKYGEGTEFLITLPKAPEKSEGEQEEKEDSEE